MMDAVTATLLVALKREIAAARRAVLENRTTEAVSTLGDCIATVEGVERRFMEGKV